MKCVQVMTEEDMKQVGELTVEDIKKLAKFDPLIYSCMRLHDVTTQAGWEAALITALYFQTKKVEMLAKELLEYKLHGPPPILLTRDDAF